MSTVHRTRDNRIHNKECRALIESGYALTLVIRAEHDELAPVPLHALKAPPSRTHRLTLTQVSAWRALSKLRPRVVHIHDPELIPLALVWARTHHAKLIYDAHEDVVRQVEHKQYLSGWRRAIARFYAKALTRLADRRADAVVAATEDVAAGFSTAKVTVVHNYPWLSDFTEPPAPVPGRLVYTGDLTEQRKLSFMIDLVERVRERVPEAHLILAGPIRPQLADVARRFDGEVVTHVGLLPPREIPALIATAELGLILLEPLPNYLTSLPTKLFEYQAAGVPVVASNFPIWVKEFGPADCAAFIDSEDLDSAADEVVALLNDPARRAQLAANGRRFVEAGHNFESQAPLLVDTVKALLR